jgi:hypothetical protein
MSQETLELLPPWKPRGNEFGSSSPFDLMSLKELSLAPYGEEPFVSNHASKLDEFVHGRALRERRITARPSGEANELIYKLYDSFAFLVFVDGNGYALQQASKIDPLLGRDRHRLSTEIGHTNLG